MNPIGRHFLGIWTRKVWERYDAPKKTIPMLVWRNVYEVSDGTRYEAPNELCAPLEECTEEERKAAEGLPAWVPPDEPKFVFSEAYKLIFGKEPSDGSP